jgi:hypothetical protein
MNLHRNCSDRGSLPSPEFQRNLLNRAALFEEMKWRIRVSSTMQPQCDATAVHGSSWAVGIVAGSSHIAGSE